MAALRRKTTCVLDSDIARRMTTTSLDRLKYFTLSKGLDFLQRSGVETRRCFEQAFRFYTGGFIHNITVEDTKDKIFKVFAFCWRSQRNSQNAHRLWVSCDKDNILEAHCTCTAGIVAGCSHVPALFYCLDALVSNGYKHVPSELSCTSLPCQWIMPRGSQIKPSAVMNHVLVTPNENRKRTAITCNLYEARTSKLQVVNKDEIIALKKSFEAQEGSTEQDNISKCTSPFSYIYDENSATIDSKFGQIQEFSFLSYQLENYQPEKQLNVNKAACSFEALPKTCSGKTHEIASSFYKNSVQVDLKECQAISLETISQNESQSWHDHRKIRICSSQFGLVCKRRSITSKFLETLFTPKDLSRVASIQHGRKAEKRAKEEFLKLNPSLHLHDIGLVINPDFPYLGSSPDAVVCSENGMQLLEIKCPFRLRHSSVKDAVGDKNFYLQFNENGVGILNPSHDYYFQIQGQLLITGIQTCMLFVFSFVDSVALTVKFDESFCDNLVAKLSEVYFSHYLPFLEKKRLKE